MMIYYGADQLPEWHVQHRTNCTLLDIEEGLDNQDTPDMVPVLVAENFHHKQPFDPFHWSFQELG